MKRRSRPLGRFAGNPRRREVASEGHPRCGAGILQGGAQHRARWKGRAPQKLGIPRAYGSYEELLADAEVDAIYNPLPNHLHVPWSSRAALAGKHVLSEKPLALDVKEARKLVTARDRGRVLVQEAVMVRTHPQWLGARALLRAGKIGKPRAVLGFFSYRRDENVRNVASMGGGGRFSTSAFAPSTSRLLLRREEPGVVSW
jgi:predicted dehydrogenase